jgi:hypothetical protein
MCVGVTLDRRNSRIKPLIPVMCVGIKTFHNVISQLIPEQNITHNFRIRSLEYNSIANIKYNTIRVG